MTPDVMLSFPDRFNAGDNIRLAVAGHLRRLLTPENEAILNV